MSAVLLNPSNPLQLVVAALDGTIRVWDYQGGILLRTLDLGAPVLHACGHSTLPDQLFVALAAPLEGERSRKRRRQSPQEALDEAVQRQYAGVYAIGLRAQALAEAESTNAPTAADATTPRHPARRMRLAQARVVRALAVSASGNHLVSLNPHTVNVCRTRALQRGFTTQLPSTDALTTMTFHPTENYFATGNERGQIRLWYDVLTESKDAGRPQATRPATALFHWHAHAVSALAFTPSGAYLMSGGEEAVLVLWQLHSGHREFVPRLGAPIVALSVMDSGVTEQQVVARLRDGSVVFVGSQKLKIAKTISGLKAGRLSFRADSVEVGF